MKKILKIGQKTKRQQRNLTKGWFLAKKRKKKVNIIDTPLARLTR